MQGILKFIKFICNEYQVKSEIFTQIYMFLFF